MVKKITISGWEFTFVFRHRWEDESDMINKYEWNTWRLGIWFKKYRVIKKPKHNESILGQKAILSNQYMFGINLLVCKFWFTICYRALILKLKDEKK